MSREFVDNTDFFSRMEQFGFFDRVEKNLPENFTTVYEIARVLEDKRHPLTQRLAPIIWDITEASENNKSVERQLIPNLAVSDEYEADLIRSTTEIVRIYPYQFLLPDEVFYRKIADRSLWMPRPKAPRNYRYQTESNSFAPDNRKQKVYVLFDTSASMQSCYRIHLAKAIAYFFLKENIKELGTVFFRTFDAVIGPLFKANDVPSFEHLISEIMHVTAEGRGTALEHALEVAIADIRELSQMGEAEILVITDGVAHINLEKIRNLTGDLITVHTVKIGHATVAVDRKIIEDQIYQSKSDEAKLLKQLFERKRELDREMSSTHQEKKKDALKTQIGYTDKQINSITQKIAEQINASYGNEIQQLSEIFIEIEDINPHEIFSLPEEQVRALEDLADDMVAVLKESTDVEDMKKAALLYDHLTVLLEFNKIDAPRLKASAQELKEVLQHIMETGEQSIGNENIPVAPSEQEQLMRMLKTTMAKSSPQSLARLLRYFFLKIKRTLSVFKKRLKGNPLYRNLRG
ncbi:MAG TPA: hypothetical protein VEC36_11040 [Patescibacteria group bacterium]|nr:hypothetical protein [Patescibacteria group bacterium]